MGRTDAVSSLLAAGADLEFKDAKGRTPLSLAVISGNADEKMVSLLLAAGADKDATDHEGRSCRARAASVGHYKKVWSLREAD
ncbi:hypothetical protein T484DRAFT_1659526, partial [Baffinella frigidus]